MKSLIPNLKDYSRQHKIQPSLTKMACTDNSFGTVLRMSDIVHYHHMSNIKHTVHDIHDILKSYYKLA